MVEFKQRLLGDLIAVEPDSTPSTSLIKLPDWQRNLRGRVLAVGPGRVLPHGDHAPMQTKVGDYGVFGAATGMESQYRGALIMVMRDDDIDGVLENDDVA